MEGAGEGLGGGVLDSSGYGPVIDMPAHTTVIERDDRIDLPFLDVFAHDLGYQIRIPPHMRIVL